MAKINSANKVAIAIGAHPDDIEFQMAGTLLLLKEAGYETHYMNVSSGNCGSLEYSGRETKQIRAREGKRAAKILGAEFHRSLTDDLQIFYNVQTLRRMAAVIREVKPTVVLTHSPQDYMEDHMITCRLAVTAAFTHGMPNFESIPPQPTYGGDVTIYHCMPHGLRDGLRQWIVAGAYVNTTSVQQTKLDSLAAHQSQQGWLDASQGMNSYLLAMEEMSLELGRMSKRFKYAEGWRRHLHFGFSASEMDPLADDLGKNYLINKTYEKNLEKGE